MASQHWDSSWLLTRFMRLSYECICLAPTEAIETQCGTVLPALCVLLGQALSSIGWSLYLPWRPRKRKDLRKAFFFLHSSFCASVNVGLSGRPVTPSVIRFLLKEAVSAEWRVLPFSRFSSLFIFEKPLMETEVFPLPAVHWHGDKQFSQSLFFPQGRLWLWREYQRQAT